MPISFLILGVIPLVPLLAAGITALLPARHTRLASGLAVSAQAIALALSVWVFYYALRLPSGPEGIGRATFNFNWLDVAEFSLPLGLLLDPLTAVMLLMVTFVSLLIFTFSLGYMSSDPRRARFFSFLSLFSAGMLGILVSNSLLLLFAAWEVVGLASYLLIGFWYERPAAANAARKAFITTRIGDIGLLLGMLWLYAESGSLLFFDGGAGVLEAASLAALAASSGILGASAATAIALLIFCGAAGKSGQFPLHVWLPDAMEGPTPVSALIHAATMVAAGVFLVARAFPLFEVGGGDGIHSPALSVVTWIGAITTLFAALIATAQFDLKRILAYSTISQLGLMMVALGVGAWPAAILHLIAHAVFKALLFLGAGSVLHGTHHTQDIRRLGGLHRAMPVTFATYSIGMMALAGFPFLFSGFWTKEAILHGAHEWPLSQGPFYIVVAGAFLTAFYMTRQMVCVFFGRWRGESDGHLPHESSRVMTLPLILLAAGTLLMTLILTPAWPWFDHFLTGQAIQLRLGALVDPSVLGLMLVSVLVVGAGVGSAFFIYRRPRTDTAQADPLETLQPASFRSLRQGLYFDTLYQTIIVRGVAGLGRGAVALDEAIIEGTLSFIGRLGKLAGKFVNRSDRSLLNGGFDRTCTGLGHLAQRLAETHTGHTQIHLRAIGLGAILLIILHAWIR